MRINGLIRTSFGRVRASQRNDSHVVFFFLLRVALQGSSSVRASLSLTAVVDQPGSRRVVVVVVVVVALEVVALESRRSVGSYNVVR